MNITRLSSFLQPPSSDLEWEETDCPLCGSDAWRPVLEAPDNSCDEGLRFLVVQCQRCNLCFTNPRPSEASIGRFYDDAYKPHHKAVEAGPSPSAWWKRFLPLGRNSLRKVLPVEGEGRLLDFGCGGGSYLIRMQRPTALPNCSLI